MQFAGLVSPGFVSGLPSALKQTALEVGSTIPEAVVFRQESVLKYHSRLDVVDAFHVSDLGARPGIGQRRDSGQWSGVEDPVARSAKGSPLG